MFEKVYEGTRETTTGRLFGVEVMRVAGEVYGKAVERFQTVVTDLADDADAWSVTHYESFGTLGEAMAYADALAR